MREFLGRARRVAVWRAHARRLVQPASIFARVVIITRVRVRHPEPDPGLSLAAAPGLGDGIESASVAVDSIWDTLAITSCPCTRERRAFEGFGREALERRGEYRVYHDPEDPLRHTDEVGGRQYGRESQSGRCAPVGLGPVMTRGITHAAGRSRCRLRTAALTGRTKTTRHWPCSVRLLATRHCDYARVRQRRAVRRHMIQNRR